MRETNDIKVKAVCKSVQLSALAILMDALQIKVELLIKQGLLLRIHIIKDVYLIYLREMHPEYLTLKNSWGLIK